MADVFTKAKRSEVMSKIRGKGNKATEVALAKLFRVWHHRLAQAVPHHGQAGLRLSETEGGRVRGWLLLARLSEAWHTTQGQQRVLGGETGDEQGAGPQGAQGVEGEGVAGGESVGA